MDERKNRDAWIELDEVSREIQNAIGSLWCICFAVTSDATRSILEMALCSTIGTLDGLQKELDAIGDRLLTESRGEAAASG